MEDKTFYDTHNNLAAVVSEIRRTRKTVESLEKIVARLVPALSACCEALSGIDTTLRSVSTDSNWNYTGAVAVDAAVTGGRQ